MDVQMAAESDTWGSLSLIVWKNVEDRLIWKKVIMFNKRSKK